MTTKNQDRIPAEFQTISDFPLVSKELRLRLGWTQADLARRLHVETDLICCWERGEGSPNGSIIADIEFLLRQADLCSEEVHQTPQAELILESTSRSQIEVLEVEDTKTTKPH